MTQTELIEAVEQTAEAVGGKVTSSYSGRGMDGRFCYGITTSNPTRCLEEAGSNGLKGAVWDSMGKDYIVYWPHIRPL